jgi:hypothetical protein
LKDHAEKGDIGMKYMDTERQLTNIFINSLHASRFAALRGEIGVCHLFCLILGGVCVTSYIFVSFYFSLAFSSYSTKLTLLHLLY